MMPHIVRAKFIRATEVDDIQYQNTPSPQKAQRVHLGRSVRYLAGLLTASHTPAEPSVRLALIYSPCVRIALVGIIYPGRSFPRDTLHRLLTSPALQRQYSQSVLSNLALRRRHNRLGLWAGAAGRQHRIARSDAVVPSHSRRPYGPSHRSLDNARPRRTHILPQLDYNLKRI
jgi:hypothetical protein